MSNRPREPPTRIRKLARWATPSNGWKSESMNSWRVLMKPAIALVALILSACAGSPADQPEQPGPDQTMVDGGEWAVRTGLIEPNSELAVAELNRKLYLLGGYPASRQTRRTVQVYDIASDRW